MIGSVPAKFNPGPGIITGKNNILFAVFTLRRKKQWHKREHTELPVVRSSL